MCGSEPSRVCSSYLLGMNATSPTTEVCIKPGMVQISLRVGGYLLVCERRTLNRSGYPALCLTCGWSPRWPQTGLGRISTETGEPRPPRRNRRVILPEPEPLTPHRRLPHDRIRPSGASRPPYVRTRRAAEPTGRRAPPDRSRSRHTDPLIEQKSRMTLGRSGGVFMFGCRLGSVGDDFAF
jgi:hypothetical protein